MENVVNDILNSNSPLIEKHTEPKSKPVMLQSKAQPAKRFGNDFRNFLIIGEPQSTVISIDSNDFSPPPIDNDQTSFLSMDSKTSSEEKENTTPTISSDSSEAYESAQMPGMFQQEVSNESVKPLLKMFKHYPIRKLKDNSNTRMKNKKKKREKCVASSSEQPPVAHASKDWTFNISNSLPPPEAVESDDEEKMRMNYITESRVSYSQPFQFQTEIDDDILEDEPEMNDGVENCNSISQQKSVEDEFPDDAFLMVTQRHWEDDVIWDGDEVKDKILSNMLNKNNPAGWVPAQIHRTWNDLNKIAGRPPLPTFYTSGLQQWLKEPAAAGMSELAGLPPWSILPQDNPLLVERLWEDDVIWDNESANLEPRLFVLDPNDENLVLGIPDDPDSEPEISTEIRGPEKIEVRKSRALLERSGLIPVSKPQRPNSPQQKIRKDPFNISNDEYYSPMATQDYILKLDSAGSFIQHSTPALKLQAPFFPTHLGLIKRKNVYRHSLKRCTSGKLSKPGFHGVRSCQKYIKEKARLQNEERELTGGGSVFFMRTARDLTSKDGELILAEYSEEHPPLMMQVGMATKISNFYKRKPGKNAQEVKYKYGETVYAHTPPFLGSLAPGQSLQAFENSLFRAPIYEHDIPETDFLLIRTRHRYYIRLVGTIFIVGQQLPFLQVPAPGSKKTAEIIRKFLEVFMYRLFWKSKDNPRRIRMQHLKASFPSYSENTIRRRLKECADFKRTGAGPSYWMLRKGFRLPPEDEIQTILSPEECCLYYSMLAGKQRLTDAGYGDKQLFSPEENDDGEGQSKLEDEVKCAPWNTTKAFISAAKGKCLLELDGVADPTGCGQGFSYVRTSTKFLSKDESNAYVKRPLMGTNADLRKLSLTEARQILIRNDVAIEDVKKMSRWEIIDTIRTLSTEQARLGENAISKYARNKSNATELQERYKANCQRLFELQNRMLSSKEILSTDEESTSDEDSELEEMGKTVESMLFSKNKVIFYRSQKNEEIERKELQKLLNESCSKDKSMSGTKNCFTSSDHEPSSTYENKELRIYRTFRKDNGETYERLEIVRDAKVIEAYDKIRKINDPELTSRYSTNPHEKAELRKERRRLLDRLRRIEKYEERMKDTHGSVNRLEQPLSNNVKCRPCGKTGHMKTNRICPLYKASVLNTPSQRIANKTMTFDMVKVDNTKLIISKRVRCVQDDSSTPVIFKNSAETSQSQGKQERFSEDSTDTDCELPKKRVRATNRQRGDRYVTLTSMFEALLNRMKQIPDSNPFWLPVNPRRVPNYGMIIKNPMDFQTMRKKLHQQEYENREDFLKDVLQILDNSILFNGPNSIYSITAGKLKDICLQYFVEHDETLMELETAVNPLISRDDQVCFSYFLEIIVEEKLRTIPGSRPFHVQMPKKYQKICKQPMDLDSLLQNIRSHKYQNREMFRSDVRLILQNSIILNGPGSAFTEKAKEIVDVCDEALEQLSPKLSEMDGCDQHVRQSSSNFMQSNTVHRNSNNRLGDLPQYFGDDRIGDLSLHCDEINESMERVKPKISNISSVDDEMELIDVEGDESDNQCYTLNNSVNTDGTDKFETSGENSMYCNSFLKNELENLRNDLELSDSN